MRQLNIISIFTSDMSHRWNKLSLIVILIVMLWGLTGKLAMGNDSATKLHGLLQGLPETLEEWTKSPEFALYDAENLYTYINGAAELYISFQFVNLISQSYANDEDDHIKIDIFDMGSPENAYGIFTHSRETIDDFVNPNIESEYAGGLLTFWKGPYYITILAYPETESRKQVVQQLARTIGAQIHGTSQRPKILSLLPQDKLQPHSTRYFKHFTWLNTYHFFSNENILNIDEKTEGVMAKYMVDSAKPVVLIILLYQTDAAAQSAHTGFRRKFLAHTKEAFSRGADQLWRGSIREKNLIAIVVDAPSLETAQRLTRSIE